MTRRPGVANCIAPVTTILTPSQLPERAIAAGWNRPVYVRGALAAGPAVAIVGARAATTVAMQWAYDIAKHLAGKGVHVVSGGALGIDGAAHRGALSGGGTTTVVLGTGVDVAYPDRHAELFREVLRAAGALASLVPDGTPPRRYSFVRRNRLIAALADMVIVVEADLRSGSLSTAHAAKIYGRLIAARPGSSGCDRLLTHGAALVEGWTDVDLALAGTVRRAQAVEGVGPELAAGAHAWGPSKGPGTSDEEVQRSIDMALVRDAMAEGALGVDAIVDRTHLSVPRVVRALARLS